MIVCSSYGVGQAPLEARKFREVCDAILERRDNKDNSNSNNNKFLEGVSFALLGLGDSHYTTFFQNPTAINAALTSAGATRVGELGKADASGTGHMEQSKVIDRWIDAIYEDLSKVVSSSNKTEDEALQKASEETWGLCLEIFPEWKPKSSGYGTTGSLVLVGVGFGVISVAIHYLLGPK